jgi:hypothetical protein
MIYAIILCLIKWISISFVLWFVYTIGYKIGKRAGYTDAVRDVIETGKFKSVEEVHGG